MKIVGKERRKSPRIRCKASILHNTNPPDFFYRGTMYNFSQGGLYFESDEDLVEGDTISVSIKQPPRQFVINTDQDLEVRIMWCRQLADSSYQIGYGAKLI